MTKSGLIEAVAERVHPALVVGPFPRGGVKPAIQLGHFSGRGQFIERVDRPAISPIAHHRIVLVDEVGRVAAAGAEPTG